MTRNPKIKLKFTSSGSYTDGKTIYMRVPPELGDVTRHVRDLCGRRGEDLRLLCPSCEGLEQAEGAIYHEVAHIAYKTFSKMNEAEKIDALFRGLALEAEGDDESKRAAKIKKVWTKRQPDSFMGASQLISPWLGQVMNAGEDGRVNQAMMDARPGTKMMFRARLYSTFKRGLTLLDGTVQHYDSINDNAQAVIAVYCKVTGFNYRPFMSPDVVAKLESPKLDNLCDRMSRSRTAKDVFLLSVPVLEELRRLGFCHAPDDVEDDEQEQPTLTIVMPKGVKPPEPEDTDGEPDDTEGDSEQPRINVVYQPDEPEPGEGSGESSEEPSGEGTDDGSGSGGLAGDESPENQDEDEGHGGSPEGSEALSDYETEPDDAPTDSQGEESPDSEDESGEAPDVQKDAGGGETTGDGHPSRSDASSGQSGADEEEADTDDETESGEEEAGDADTENRVEGDTEDAASDDGEADHEAESESSENSPEAQSEKPEEDGESDEADVAKLEADKDETEEAFNQFSGHSDMRDPKDEGETPREEREMAAVAIAIRQQDFDTPSRRILGVNVKRYDDGWHQRDGFGAGRWQREIKISESILAPSLARLRQAFSANKRSHYNSDLTSGKVNGRVLGKRIPADDNRLFRKKTKKQKRDYFVQVGLDISGSTNDGCIVLIKESACAMAELLNRLGVRFAVHAHTGGPTDGDYRGLEVLIYQVKGPDEPWNDRCRQQMGELQPEWANLDGHTMEFYRKRLEEQRATDKILLYYTDGAMPAENFAEELEVLQREIKICQAQSINVVGVGIGNDDPSEHGLHTIRLDDIEDIPRLIRDLERRLNR